MGRDRVDESTGTLWRISKIIDQNGELSSDTEKLLKCLSHIKLNSNDQFLRVGSTSNRTDPMFVLTLEIKRDQKWMTEDALTSLQEWTETESVNRLLNNLYVTTNRHHDNLQTLSP